MKKKINPFKLGLFVLTGAAIVLGGMIWIGAAHLFQKSKTYVSFFDYSVRGLNPGTDIEHLGIKVGRVSSVSLSRNGRLVQVVMDIYGKFEVKENQAVEIKLAGLTGGNYLAIVEAPKNLKEITPKIDFPTNYPVIPSTKGTITQVENALEDIFKKVQGFHTEGILSSWAEVGKNANKLLSNEDIDQTLSNLKTASASMKNLLHNIGRAEKISEIDKGIENLAKASESIREAGAAISRQIVAMPPNSLATVAERMEKAAKETESVIGSMNSQMDKTLSLFQQSAHQINQVLTDLEGLVQSLREEPGRIFKQPSSSEPFRR